MYNYLLFTKIRSLDNHSFILSNLILFPIKHNDSKNSMWVWWVSYWPTWVMHNKLFWFRTRMLKFSLKFCTASTVPTFLLKRFLPVISDFTPWLTPIPYRISLIVNITDKSKNYNLLIIWTDQGFRIFIILTLPIQFPFWQLWWLPNCKMHH